MPWILHFKWLMINFMSCEFYLKLIKRMMSMGNLWHLLIARLCWVAQRVKRWHKSPCTSLFLCLFPSFLFLSDVWGWRLLKGKSGLGVFCSSKGLCLKRRGKGAKEGERMERRKEGLRSGTRWLSQLTGGRSALGRVTELPILPPPQPAAIPPCSR